MLFSETHIVAIGLGVFIVALASVFILFPPKRINYIYGYRTKRSMINQDTWDEAHTYSSKWLLRFGLATIVAAFVFNILIPQLVIVATSAFMVLLLICILPLTETHLKRHFDNQGNPKSLSNDLQDKPAVKSMEEE